MMMIIIMVGLVNDCAKCIIDVVFSYAKEIVFATGAWKDFKELITRKHVKLRNLLKYQIANVEYLAI